MNKSETIISAQSDEAIAGWHWTDYLSHYRFWALVLGLFFMQLTHHFFNQSQYSFLFASSAFERDWLDLLFPISVIGSVLSASFVLYVLRKRFKTALICFSTVYILLTIIFFFSGDLPAPILFLTSLCIRMLHTGFLITALVVLPAIISVILIAFANKQFFRAAPAKTIEPQAGPRRSPVAVALLTAFIPFYYYYFLATRPRELKAIAPEIKTPTGGGMIAMLMFFGITLPIWFAHTRKALKAEHPENAELQKRSHKFIGFISILFPVFGAAMIQSDINALDPVSSERAID